MKLVKPIIILGILLLFACKSEEEEVVIPVGVLSQEEMIAILADVHTADAFAESQRIDNTSKLLTLKLAYFDDVLLKHGLTQAEFDSSLYFYQDNLELYFETYNLVLEELSVREADLSEN